VFGWCLIRNTDLALLREQLAGERARTDALYERLIRVSAEAGAKGGEATMALARLNAMEQEAAHTRHRLNGSPAVAPQVSPTGSSTGVHGQPLLSDLPLAGQVGAGMDLFSDVGEARAHELRERGLLHDDDGADDIPPAAAALTAGL
jgi:hypothetical protein